jgi:predicted nucleic acid-binding Zn ribbon protein
MTSMPVIQRCLTCKTALPAGLEGYCSEACRLKVGRSKRAPGRVAARRRRRRGGRKL